MAKIAPHTSCNDWLWSNDPGDLLFQQQQALHHCEVLSIEKSVSVRRLD